ncbi:hypothetical protein J8J27_35300, partial [Mycobacterium tuberculosis]|nr:hypothetical protein [Mycobacterium tuberculosis]
MSDILAPVTAPEIPSITKRAETAPTVDAKPSLVGMTRAEMAAALEGVGIDKKQIRMRVGQLWHWIYMRGVHG